VRRNLIMEFHEVANIFPLMEGEEYGALVEDIRKNGLMEAIWTYQGKIIDGRNRYLACQEIGIQPKYQEWDGKGSLVNFVVSLNLHRRHLTSSQKAVVAAEMLPWLEKENEEKRRQKISETRRGETSQKFEPSHKSTEQAATITGTNRQYVSDVKKIKEVAPEVLEKIRAGSINITEAKKIASMPEEKRDAVLKKVEAGETARNAIKKTYQEEARELSKNPIVLPSGKFKVIEVDPPWELDNFEGKSPGMQYPLMNLEQLKDLAPKILEMADDDCHLYLWAINPMLPEAFEIMKAWGFEYKTCITWIKSNGFGTGHYYRGQTEHVLFGVRGKMGTMRNDQPNYFEAPKGRHSEKPARFYEIVESMSSGPKVRLFARSNRDGWVSWGNEV
jgi:N6-adenosine-specific RNA methylase IME4